MDARPIRLLTSAAMIVGEESGQRIKPPFATAGVIILITSAGGLIVCLIFSKLDPFAQL